MVDKKGASQSFKTTSWEVRPRTQSWLLHQGPAMVHLSMHSRKIKVISSDHKTPYHLVNETIHIHIHPVLIPEMICDSKDNPGQLRWVKLWCVCSSTEGSNRKLQQGVWVRSTGLQYQVTRVKTAAPHYLVVRQGKAELHEPVAIRIKYMKSAFCNA